MPTYINMKLAVSSPSELQSVVCKLVSLGYGIGSNREKHLRDTSYNHVFAYDDGMILFGRNQIGFGANGTSFDRSRHPAVRIEDFLA